MIEAEFEFRAHAFNHFYLCTSDNLDKNRNNKNIIKDSHDSDPLVQASMTTTEVHGFSVSACSKPPLTWTWLIADPQCISYYWGIILTSEHHQIMIYYYLRCKEAYVLYYIIFWPHCVVCRILVPAPGVEPVSPAMGVQSPNPWPPGNSHHMYFKASQLYFLLNDICSW